MITALEEIDLHSEVDCQFTLGYFIEASELDCQFQHWDFAKKYYPEGQFQWSAYKVSVSQGADS
jgi:hypothetical protein